MATNNRISGNVDPAKQVNMDRNGMTVLVSSFIAHSLCEIKEGNWNPEAIRNKIWESKFYKKYKTMDDKSIDLGKCNLYLKSIEKIKTCWLVEAKNKNIEKC